MKRGVGVVVAAVLLAVVAVGLVAAQGAGLKLVQVIPAELRFSETPYGTLQAGVIGDSTGPGLYAIRTRIPAGTRLEPHSHPDDRIVVVLGGTLHIGFGTEFDETKLKALPVGSVFTEPAGQPHFSWAKDAGVVLHITGTGPTGTTPVQAR